MQSMAQWPGFAKCMAESISLAAIMMLLCVHVSLDSGLLSAVKTSMAHGVFI